jgi:4-diphosphocytidyl-2-C-methyl-D-erythritol kinase
VADAEEIQSRTARIHSGPLVQAIAHKEGKLVGRLLHNDLEKVVLPEFPEVARLREACQNAGVLGAMMSGSGPTVFALCESPTAAERVKQRVQEAMATPELEFWLTKLASTGIQIQ